MARIVLTAKSRQTLKELGFEEVHSGSAMGGWFGDVYILVWENGTSYVTIRGGKQVKFELTEYWIPLVKYMAYHALRQEIGRMREEIDRVETLSDRFFKKTILNLKA